MNKLIRTMLSSFSLSRRENAGVRFDGMSGIDSANDVDGCVGLHPNPLPEREGIRGARVALAMLLAIGSYVPLARAADPLPVGLTLKDDLKTTNVKLLPGYASQRPRLLFGPNDREALRKKSEELPELWKAVLANANRLAAVPDSQTIATGAKYWRIEGVQSASLAWFVTGEKKYIDLATPWLVSHCREPVWGTQYRPNLDLQASWYLYHISFAYDILHGELSESDRTVIREGLASHAKAIYDGFDPFTQKDNLRYEQNHTYIPAVALASAALALQGEVPEASDWLNRAYAVLRRCRFVMGDDGYYYEGYGYWTYALHWHVRYADLVERATGERMHDAPFLSKNWLFGLHLSLPGSPGAFDVGDLGQWSGDARPKVTVTNHAMMWGLAGALKSGESRTVGDLYQSRGAERDYPAAAFLWAAPEVAPAKLESIKPYHYFEDHDVIAWRSGWGEDATAYLFRCGPPEGHKAAEKLKQIKDWTMNAGHVHPDIGAFYMFAKGTYLAVSTGYTAEKWTKDHNTLLIDGKGQGIDGAYHNDRGVPYDQFNSARIEQAYLADDYAFATGVFGGAYSRQVRNVDVRRSVLMNKRWMLVVDDMSSPQDQTLTWYCHSEAPFKSIGGAFVASQSKAALAVIPIPGVRLNASTEPTTVIAGIKPGAGTPTQRGHHLSFTTAEPAKSVRLANVLVAIDAGATAPTIESSQLQGDKISFNLKWADGRSEKVNLNLKWKSGDASDAKPANIEVK